MPGLVAIGVDGCRSGWLAVGTAELDGEDVAIRHCASFEDVLRWRRENGDRAVVAIDVPIGLTASGGLRRADREAREAIGARRNSVFAPPGRNLLDAAGYAEGRARVAEAKEAYPSAQGLSRQAFGIMPKIREVDEVLGDLADHESWLIEAHPEVSFHLWAERAGGKVLPPKRSAAGVAERLNLVLARYPEFIAEAGLRSSKPPGSRPTSPMCSTPWPRSGRRGDGRWARRRCSARGTGTRPAIRCGLSLRPATAASAPIAIASAGPASAGHQRDRPAPERARGVST